MAGGDAPNFFISPQFISGGISSSRDSVFNTRNLTGILSYEMRILNLTSQPVYFVDGSGVISTLNPCTALKCNDTIVIQHTRRVSGGSLSTIPGSEEVGLSVIRQATAINARQASWDECVSLDDVKSSRGGAYLCSGGVVLYLNYADAVERGHPLNNQSANNQLLHSVMEGFDARAMIGVNLMLVGKASEVGPRYVIFHDQVAELIPVPHPSLPDGLHVSGMPSMVENAGNAYRNVKHYTPQEYEKDECPFRLYTSALQAKTALEKRRSAPLDTVITQQAIQHDHEHSLADKAREAEILKLNNLIEKQKALETERNLDAALKAQKATEDALKRMMEMESERREDERQRRLAQEREYNESRKLSIERHTQDRTSFMETVKTVGILATAGLTLWKVLS